MNVTFSISRKPTQPNHSTFALNRNLTCPMCGVRARGFLFVFNHAGTMLPLGLPDKTENSIEFGCTYPNLDLAHSIGRTETSFVRFMHKGKKYAYILFFVPIAIATAVWLRNQKAF